VARFEDAIRNGGLYALAMPRGSGKTSIVEVACLWAMLTGLHKFVMIIGSAREHALELLSSIKEELMANAELAADFPEVCHPIAALENRANRCKGQHIRGKQTRSVWGTDKIVLPTVGRSVASGATARVAGITGRVRGAKKETLRPTLCILDDPQTDTSAKSASQCAKRAGIINGAVLGLAGPGKKITAIMPCTVIAKGDLADTFLDREKSPLWTGHRFKMVYEFPKRMDLWDHYAVMRTDEFRNSGTGTYATAYYEQHRQEMDLGAVIAWPERHRPDEISGIQSAMNLFYADKYAFWSEYQNAPLTEGLGEGQLLAEKVAARISGIERGVLPVACSQVTAFIDVQSSILYYVVCAWAENFSGSIIDYGTWPDQGRPYFTAADAQKTFARMFPDAGIEGQVHNALSLLTDQLLSRNWVREDGAPFRIERMLIDAGFQTETVKQFCRTTQYAATVMPSHGHGIGAAGKPWSEYDRSRCERLGLHWMIPKLEASKRAFRHVTIDTNFWKSFIAQRLAQSVGDKGSVTLFGKPGQDHRMIADHLTSEYWIATEGRGRKLQEWRIKPGTTENHWWDGLVGSAVAASMGGSAILEKPPVQPKVKTSREEYERKRREFETRRGF
jgi:hypothetical protein